MMNSAEILLTIIKHEGLNKNSFAKAIGVNYKQVYDIISGDTKSITNKFADKILHPFPHYKKSWIMTGEGEMFNNSSTIPHIEELSIGIPHIEAIEAYCGPGQGFDVTVMRKECPTYNIPGMEGADFTIRAKGRSMINRDYPDRSVKEGDYIGCVKCRSGVVRYGEVYALATSEGVMIKIVQESDREGYVLLESFNKEEGFKPFHYPIIDIHDWALVVAVASISRWA